MDRRQHTLGWMVLVGASLAIGCGSDGSRRADAALDFDAGASHGGDAAIGRDASRGGDAALDFDGAAGVDGAAHGFDGGDRSDDASVIQLGFNAKGTLDTEAQIALARTMLSAMPATTRSRLHVRVTGGTRSQTETSLDWTDAQLDAWIGLQADEGIGFVFVINGNDTPDNQAAFVQRWIDRGARFSFLEMMNEYYLPKFRNGDTSHPEVTRVVTAESYTTEILPAYMAALARFGLPFFVIAAPSRNAALAEWNDVVVGAINDHAAWHVGVTLHLYDSGESAFDYTQIDALRARLPAGTPIAITESGVTDPSVGSYAEAAPRFTAHDGAVLAHLVPGDYLFDQILYSSYRDDVTATLHPSYDGLTPKGTAVVELFEAATR